MSFALNEVDAIAKKATRGAGYSWGMAEEAGKATRWLCANGIDGSRALLSVLTVADNSSPAQMAPTGVVGDWRSEGGEMCPLMAGATFSDVAGVGHADEVCILNMVSPVMLLPFVAMAARQLGQLLTAQWAGILATTDGHVLSFDSADNPDFWTVAKSVTIRVGGQIGQKMPKHTRAEPKDADWKTLSRFAHRTYAPASSESRIKGAGAGLSDND